MLVKSQTLTSGLKALRAVSNLRLIYSFVVVIFHKFKRLTGITMEDNKPHYEKTYIIPGLKLRLYFLSKAVNRNFIDFIKPVLLDISKINSDNVSDSDLVDMFIKIKSIYEWVEPNNCELPEFEHRVLSSQLNDLLSETAAYLYMDKDIQANSENRALFVDSIKQGIKEITFT